MNEPTEGGEETKAPPFSTPRVAFRIPGSPPSINSLYNVLFSMRKIELKPEARLYKSQAKQFIPPFPIEKEWLLKLDLTVHGNWFYKNTNLKKADVQNMQKILVDIVSEKLGFDDAQIWEVTLRKIQDIEDFTDGILTVIGRY